MRKEEAGRGGEKKKREGKKRRGRRETSGALALNK